MNSNGSKFFRINVKNINKHAVLDLIGLSQVGISRVELSRQLGLTRAGITVIVNDLIKSGLVREAGLTRANRHGAVGLEINPDRGRVLGIDISASHLSVILANFQAQVIAEFEEPLDITQGAVLCLTQIDFKVRSMLRDNGYDLSSISSIGMGVPGPLVSDVGVVSASPIMPGWDNFPIGKWMEDTWKIPSSLRNDTEMGALGEWTYGAGRGESNLAYIKVGTGIGACLLIDGKIYRGATGCAGEIGHMTLDPEGPLCTCGNYGCLEAFAGERAIAAQAMQAVLSGQRTVLSEIQPVQSITAKHVQAACRRGDYVSQRLIREAGYKLGTAIASLVNLFNPSMIVIGGGVSQMGDLLLEPVRLEVKKRSLKPASQMLKISAALLGRRSSGMGAIADAISTSVHQIAEENINDFLGAALHKSALLNNSQ